MHEAHKKAHNIQKKPLKSIDTSERTVYQMANIRENQKNEKTVSYRFISCLGRDIHGKQCPILWVAPGIPRSICE